LLADAVPFIRIADCTDIGFVGRGIKGVWSTEYSRHVREVLQRGGVRVEESSDGAPILSDESVGGPVHYLSPEATCSDDDELAWCQCGNQWAV
jgi:hypothetical protein